MNIIIAQIHLNRLCSAEGPSVDNYTYDPIGNLITDVSENITNISWNVYGKITAVNYSNTASGTIKNVYYYYDASGNRMGKRAEKNTSTGTSNTYTWYVRDASGNVMATYGSTANNSSNPANLSVKERHMYGSSRLGILALSKDVRASMPSYTQTTPYKSSFIRGFKYYELSNHLGNVLATVSDKKFAHTTNGTVDYYTADMVSATDYMPFGSSLPNRSFGSSAYRYAFNGKEKDKDGTGTSIQYDYGFRIYDPHLGRFKSVDPLTKSYPYYTPYQFAGNKPIMAVDLDGLEEWVAIFLNNNNKPTAFRFAPDLKPLSAGQIYKHTFNLQTGAFSSSIYDANKKAIVNIAFIPNAGLIKKDQNHEHFDVMSAYYQDAKFFNGLSAESQNFAAIGIEDLEDMVFKGVTYAMENNVSIKDAIIDFHGTQHMEKRSDNRPHKLNFGASELQVDANGSPSNYNNKTSQLFQLLGKFRSDNSQTLMGACNADKCTQVLTLMSKDMNSTIYGHKSYSYSSNLTNGKFYGDFLSKAFNKFFDGNGENQGKYIKVTPDGTVSSMGGVQFSTDKKTAGEISPAQ